MIPPSPTAGTRARSRGTRARSFASAGAWLLSILLVLGLSMTAIPAGAATPVPVPSASPSGEALTGETVFTLSPVARGTVRAGESLAVSVTLQNGTDAATPAVTATLSIGAAALADRAALSAWLTGDGFGIAVVPAGTAALEPVPSGGELTTGIVVAPQNPALAARPPGVYPLLASYDGPDGRVVSTSVMIVPDDAAAPIGIGVVVPITAGPISEGLLTAAELTELTAVDGTLTAQLDAVEATDAILAVDPAVVAAIRVLGSAAPASATDWLSRLDALANSRFALQYGDADIATQLAAGASTPLAPTSLQYAMVPESFRPEASATATPTPGPTASATDAPVDPTAPVYPTTAQLLEVDAARGAVYWPAAGTAGPDVVATLGAITVDDRESLTLLPSSSITAGAGGATVAAHA